MRLKNDFYAMLGFAARARACVSGYTAVERGIRKRQVRLMIMDESVSEQTRKRIAALCSNCQVPYLLAGPEGIPGHSIGKPAAKLIGVTQQLFADRMRQIAEQSAEKTEVED